MSRYINPNFSYIQLQSARKLYHSSHHNKHRQKLYLMLSIREYSDYDTYVHRKKSYSWITDTRFLYREQDWIRFRHCNCYKFGNGHCISCGDMKDSVSAALLSLVVCPHLQRPLEKAITETKFEAIMTCRASHWDDPWLNNNCSTCSGLHQCQICPTEFQLDTKDYDLFDKRLILTRWLDLGEGLTPGDPKWTSHIGSNDGGEEKPLPFKAGSLKATFQKLSGPPALFRLDNPVAVFLGYDQPLNIRSKAKK